MIRRRIPTEQLFDADLKPIGDRTLDIAIDALHRASLALAADPAGTLPSCPLSQLEALEAV